MTDRFAIKEYQKFFDTSKDGIKMNIYKDTKSNILNLCENFKDLNKNIESKITVNNLKMKVLEIFQQILL